MKEKIKIYARELLDIVKPLGVKVDRRTMIVLISIPVCLTLIHFLGMPFNLFSLAPSLKANNPDINRLLGLIYWSCSCGVGYVLIPWVITRFVFREGVAGYGLNSKGITKHLWIYLVLFLMVFPFVVLVSFSPSFKAIYPFYKPPTGGWMLFLIFEIFYLVQFFYLEFFFRGYIIFNLEKSLGYYSVLIMAIPYCMIHFQKPLPEALAAIGAGIILGMLALKTRSLWYGVLIHVSVAFSMDILALLQTGVLFRLFSS
jgi:uncharacterized protein